MYGTISRAFRLQHARTCRAAVNRANSSFNLQPGINSLVIKNEAPRRFGPKRVFNSGDATRGRRELVKSPWSAHLIGVVFPADVAKWPSEPGIPIPQGVADLLTVLDEVRRYNCLSHNFDTELFRCIEDRSVAMLVHTIFPEPHRGWTGFMNMKLWIEITNRAAAAQLNCMGFCSDCCGNGMGAIKLVGTPTKALIALGAKYIGLPAEDYDYFGLGIRPSIPVGELLQPKDYDGLLSNAWKPPFLMAWCDDPHSVRNGRRCILRNNKKTIVMYSEKGEGGEEAGLWASGLYIARMAEDRVLSGRYNLKEMLTFNDFMDQKGDAAYHLASYRTIRLLERAPINGIDPDRATILALIALNYSSNPWKTKHFTNPFMIVEFVWCATAIWEMQELYVQELVGRIDLHCPSSQFRETQRLNACAATNLCLDHYRSKEQFGTQTRDWSRLGLAECNQDGVESFHSEERCGQTTKGNGADSVNLSDHCACMSRAQKIFDRRPMLEAAGLRIGKPKHTEKSQNCIIDLGLPMGMTRQDIEYGAHTVPQVPLCHDDFVELIEDARGTGYKRGLHYWEKLIPESVLQMKQRRIWRESIKDRPKKKHPVNKDIWLSQGPIAVMAMPPALITTEDFAKGISEHDLKKQKQWEDSITHEINEGNVAVTEDEDSQGVQAYLTPRVKDIIKKAETDRTELVQFTALKEVVDSDDEGDRKPYSIVVGNMSGAVVSWKQLLSGECLLDDSQDGKLVKLAQVLRGHQLRDNHSRERGKRFWVGRLKSFARAETARQAGHDITIGTCLIVDWGGANTFAVVRVLRIIDGDDSVFSIALMPKSTTKKFQVELLDPVGTRTFEGPALTLTLPGYVPSPNKKYLN